MAGPSSFWGSRLNKLFGSQLGCSRTACRNSCCPDSPPAVVDILLDAGTPCECKFGTLTYSNTLNPDGRFGMWVGEIAVECGGGCAVGTIKVEWWCGESCDTLCECDCINWSIRINEGDIHRISDFAPPINQCCCEGTDGTRNQAYWNDVVAGTHDDFDCDALSFTVNIWWQNIQACRETVMSGCCKIPMSETLDVEIVNGCGTFFGTVVAAGNMDCTACSTKWSTPTPITIQCVDQYDSCFNTDIDIDLDCIRCEQLPGGCDPTEWEMTVAACWGTRTELVDNCACPECETEFEITTVFTEPAVSGCGDCNLGNQSLAVKFTDRCRQIKACPSMPGTINVTLFSDGEQADCDHGCANLYFENKANDCGCVGQWRGSVDIECKVLGVCTTETLEVKLCAICEECDISNCDPTDWVITVGNTTKSPLLSDTCCDGVGLARSWLYFENVVPATAGACNGKNIDAKIWWQGEPPSNPVAKRNCTAGIPEGLLVDITDTCGVTLDPKILRGSDTCDDTDSAYFGIWTTGAFQMDCLDGAVCTLMTTNPTFTIRQKKSDFLWEAVLTGCFNASPRIVAFTPTCPTCAGTKFSSGTITFPGPWSDCECDNSASVVVTVTEP